MQPIPQPIPWCPPNLAPELAGVMVPRGQVTERQWWMALADRVSDQVTKSDNPEQAMLQAAQALGVPPPDEPRQAGEVLVQRNLALRTAMTLAVMTESDPFPAQVTRGSNPTLVAIEETDLPTWLEMAASMVNASSLD